MATQSLAADELRTSEPRTRTVWQVDPAHSSVEFSVRHMMVATVRGVFKNVVGSVALDEGNLEDSQVEAELEAASLDTGIADRDAHLRSSDFFDVARFPKLTFRSTRVHVDRPDAGTLYGELTIHGVTKSVAFDVSYLGEVRDPWGHRRRGFVAETTVHRKDYGMTWNQILDSGGVLVGDKVKVTLNVEAVEKA